MGQDFGVVPEGEKLFLIGEIVDFGHTRKPSFHHVVDIGGFVAFHRIAEHQQDLQLGHHALEGLGSSAAP